MCSLHRRTALALLALGLTPAAWPGEPDVPPAEGPSGYYDLGRTFGARLQVLEQQGGRVELAPLLRGILDGLNGTAPGNRADTGGRVPPEKSPVPVRNRGYVDDYAALNAEREGVEVLPNGVQYEVLAAGEGRRVRADSTVRAHYRGTLASGVEFDSTYGQEEPAVLRVDQVVARGLRETLPLMREGDRWRITIPAALGFTGGRLLRKRDLVYELEVVSVVDPAPAAAPGAGAPAGGAKD